MFISYQTPTDPDSGERAQAHSNYTIHDQRPFLKTHVRSTDFAD
jgi:hypothetical protein